MKHYTALRMILVPSIVAVSFLAASCDRNDLDWGQADVDGGKVEASGMPNNWVLYESGDATTVNIRLSVAPASEVTITPIGPSAVLARLAFDPPSLTFAKNQLSSQSIIVSAPNNDADGESDDPTPLRFSAYSQDERYFAKEDTTFITIIDDDVPGIVVLLEQLSSVDEGDTLSFTVRLRSKPASAVNVYMRCQSGFSDTRLAFPDSPLTIAGEDWNLPRVMRATIINDHQDQDTEVQVPIEFVATSQYITYGVPIIHELSILDDDYTISAGAGQHGTIHPSGPVVVTAGTDTMFTMIPDAHYAVADVMVDNVSVGAVSSFAFYDVQAAHTINVAFTLATYTLAPSAGLHGTIQPSQPVQVVDGGSQLFTFNPDNGYVVADVIIDDISRGAMASYQFENVTANHTIRVTFGVAAFTITPTAGPNGVIEPSEPVHLAYGASQTFHMVANEGYEVADVRVDDESVGAIASYEFENVQADHTISATFRSRQFVITSNAGTGGSISPAGEQIVDYNESKEFFIEADMCYEIQDVLVDGVSVGAVTNYEFAGVQANHSIEARFVKVLFTITSSAGEGGTISPVGNVVVGCGEDQAFIIQPNTGYTVADVLVDGVSQGARYSVTFTNVVEDHTISAIFVLMRFTILASAGPHGSISPNGEVIVNYGADQSFEISAALGWFVEDVVVDNVSVGAIERYTFEEVKGSHTIAASFVNSPPGAATRR